MSIFKNQTDNDDLLASDLAVVYGAPRMSPPREAEQRQRLVEFATTLDRVAAHNGGMSAMVVAADTGTEKKGLGRYLRGLATAVVVLITTTAGVSTVAHNVWGTKTPIVVNVTIPALQQHSASAAHVGTHTAVKQAPSILTVKQPLLVAKGLTLGNFFNYDAVHVTSIDEQGASLPKVASQPFTGVKMDVNVDQSNWTQSLEMSLNTQALPPGYKALKFYLGLADDSETSGKVIFEIDRDGVVFQRMTVQAGTIAQSITVPFDGHSLLRFFTRSVAGECCGDLNVIVGKPQAVP